MITTEITIDDHIKLADEDIQLIRQVAYLDAVDKLMKVSEGSINEVELDFGYELICRVTIKPKK